MVTVQEVFDLAIELDMVKLAHRIFWAISKGEVTVADQSEKLESIQYDEDAVAEMVQQNLLSIGKIKLFAIETPNPGIYAFYYGENALQAHSLHYEMFREQPKRIAGADHLMTKMFNFSDTGKSEILYFQRKQAAAYPFYLGHARAGDHTLYKLKKAS